MLALRPRHLALFAMAVLISTATGGSALAASTTPRVVHRGQPASMPQADLERLAADATKRSIIIFKDQHAEAPARLAGPQRAQAVDMDQAAVRNELSQLNTRDVKTFHLINAVAATISQAEIENLSLNPSVQAVVPDALRTFNSQDQAGARGAAAVAGQVTGNVAQQQICPPDAKVPMLEPEALQVMKVEFQSGSSQPAAHDLADGSGVRVGILADGLDPNNPDLRRDGHSIIFDYQDFSGFGNNAPTGGREAFLDAGAIASQGTQVYDLSRFVNPAHPLPPGCTIRIKGVAPGVSLAVMNLQGSNGGFFNSTIIQAIERAVDVDQVDVLNESLGGNPIPDTRDDPVALANVAAVAAGVVVVASTGDAGPTNTIGSPASSEGIIAAAGTTTYRVYRQTTRYGTQLSAGGWISNNITALSSAGTTEFGARVPDVAAPGDRGWELCSTDTTHYFGCADIDHGAHPPALQAAGGTSLSSPLVSGTAALVIQAYRKTHAGATPSPELVKRIIVSSADDLGAPSDHQGAGLVNSLKAVQVAMSIVDANGTGKPTGIGLLVDKPNLHAVAAPGQQQSFSIQVTNTGTVKQTLNPTLVGLDPRAISADTGSVSLSSTLPTFIDGEGSTDFYVLHQFNVPSGVDYLNGDIAWDAHNTSSAVFETLFDPFGRVAAYSLLGSARSGRGHVEVRHPSAGPWTAAIFTVDNGAVYSGKVEFGFTTQRIVSAGSVSPANPNLTPGQSVTLDVKVDSIDQPGDHVATLRLPGGGATHAGIPVVVRTLVPLTNQGASFDGVLTGGGVSGPSGQRLTYQFDVPNGKPSLNVAVRLRDPNYHLTGFLIDPSGMPRDVQTTEVFGPGTDEGIGRTMQFFHATPGGGRWTLSLVVSSPIDGAHLNEPFNASIDFKAASIDTHGLPNSPTTTLQAGKPVTARINLVNTGNANKDFFVDARLRGRQLMELVGVDINAVPLPLSLLAQPHWLVPTNTSLLLVGAQGSVPIVLEVGATNGDPDRAGPSQPDNLSLTAVAGTELYPGFFFGIPEPLGPFGPNGLGTKETVNLVAAAITNPFDLDVTSDTGDVWQQSVYENPAPYAPLTLRPGQPGVINLVITPTGAPGTVVHGFVAVDTFNFDSFSGDEVALLPYTYTVR